MRNNNINSTQQGIKIYYDYIFMRNNRDIIEYGFFGLRFSMCITANCLSFIFYYCDHIDLTFNLWNKLTSNIFTFLYSCNIFRPGLLLYNVNRNFCIDNVMNNIYKIIGIETICFYFSNITSSFLLYFLYDLFFFHSCFNATFKNINIYLLNPFLVLNNNDIVLINYIITFVKKNSLKINFYIINFLYSVNFDFNFLYSIGEIFIYNFYIDIMCYIDIYRSSILVYINYFYIVIFGNLVDLLYQSEEFKSFTHKNEEKVSLTINTKSKKPKNYNNCYYTEKKARNLFSKNITKNIFYNLVCNIISLFMFLHDYFLTFTGMCDFNMCNIVSSNLLFYFISSLFFVLLLILLCFLSISVLLQNNMLILFLQLIYLKLKLTINYINSKLLMFN